MKTPLRISAPTPAGRGVPPAPELVSASTLASASASVPVRSTWQRLVAVLTRPAVLLPSLLVCCAVLSWSLGVRLRGTDRLMIVRARSLKPIEITEPPVAESELAALRREALRVSVGLLSRPQDVTSIVTGLEQQARVLGWRAEFSLQPGLPAVGGLAELTSQRAVFQLEDASGGDIAAYARLLSWLRVVSSLSNHVEVSSLHLRSAGAGLAGARLELTFLSGVLRTNGLIHEETSSK